MRLFQINYKKLIFVLLPGYLRSKNVGALMVSAVQPIIGLYNRFIKNRATNNYKLAHNGQVCYLRALLNDSFPDRNSSFEIIDIESEGSWQFCYQEQSYNQLFAPAAPEAEILYSVPAIISGTANFLVIIPNNLTGFDTLNQIKSLVNEYKLVSKKAFYEYSELP
ncbi:MAG: hypothetical protein PHE56_04090 [Bacteroidales bacterium]|nr:hypothetical protein [Bacteroidales bacterium]